MKTTSFVAFLLFALCCALTANAAVVTFSITATVDSVDDPSGLLGGSITGGDTMTGILQYDLAMSDEDPGPSFGFYYADPPGNNFMEGTNGASGFFETIDFFAISKLDNGFAGDSVEFQAGGDTSPSSLDAPGVDAVNLWINLGDTDGTAFSDDSPPASLNLADFEIKQLQLWAEDSTFQLAYFVDATITDITDITQVPEPSTLLLVSLAIAGLLLTHSVNRRALVLCHS